MMIIIIAISNIISILSNNNMKKTKINQKVNRLINKLIIII